MLSGDRPILLVEDSQSDALLLKRAFAKAGVETPIEHVPSGDAAIAYISGFRQYTDRQKYPLPGLILLDLSLPSVGGLQLLSFIRSTPIVRRIPVVVLSGNANEAAMAAAYDSGANSYLVKANTAQQMEKMAATIASYWLQLNCVPATTSEASAKPKAV
jgi:CheY-like chemotaxis protein